VAAYRLMEQAQSEEHQAAASGLAALAAAAQDAGWDEVVVLAHLGLAMYAILRPSVPTTDHPGLDELVTGAEELAAPALLALALGLRAVLDGARGESEALLQDAARALVLLEDPQLPALDACAALVAVAAAYIGQSLWELADEIYARAAELSPLGEEPIQNAAIAVNRVLIPLEWASALLEEGDSGAADEQFTRALAATDEALTTPGLPELWREELVACVTGLRLYLDPPDDPGPLLAEAEARTAGLREHDDVEILPLVEALVGLALLRLGRVDAAYAWSSASSASSASVPSATTGSRTFPAWVRATVLLAQDPCPPAVVPVWREYASMLAAQRREARAALLSAARSHLAGERLRSEHVRLRHEVASDALTGLANRRAFDAWVRGVRPAAQPTGMVLLDLDEFKAVNDSHGHSVGDDVLRCVGRLVARHVRPQDLALRLGGDEFAVILEGDLDTRPGGPAPIAAAMAGAVRDRAEALRQALGTEPWSDLATGLTVTAAIGVAVDMVADAADAQALYRRADEDLYRSKGRMHAAEHLTARDTV
jgi:diguanylate cyclase (GGDEF)-like protein